MRAADFDVVGNDAVDQLVTRRDGGRSVLVVGALPFRMGCYPLPVVLSVCIWLFIWFSTGYAALLGLFLTACGVVVYFVARDSWRRKEPTGFDFEEGDDAKKKMT